MADFGNDFLAGVELMLVMRGRVTSILVGVGIVIAEDVFAVGVTRVIRVSNRLRVLHCAISRYLEVLGDIDYDVSLTKDFPGHFASVRGNLD